MPVEARRRGAKTLFIQPAIVLSFYRAKAKTKRSTYGRIQVGRKRNTTAKVCCVSAQKPGSLSSQRRWRTTPAMELMLCIVGDNLADINFGERSMGEGRSCLYLGIQKGQEVVDAIPVTAASATFTACFSVSPLPDGGVNFLGPYAHGTRTARFCYLCWVAEDADGTKSMFARIKLHLSPLRWARVEAATRLETLLVLRFSLRGKGGGPVCASVPNDAIHWEG